MLTLILFNEFDKLLSLLVDSGTIKLTFLLFKDNLLKSIG